MGLFYLHGVHVLNSKYIRFPCYTFTLFDYHLVIHTVLGKSR